MLHKSNQVAIRSPKSTWPARLDSPWILCFKSEENYSFSQGFLADNHKGDGWKAPAESKERRKFLSICATLGKMMLGQPQFSLPQVSWWGSGNETVTHSTHISASTSLHNLLTNFRQIRKGGKCLQWSWKPENLMKRDDWSQTPLLSAILNIGDSTQVNPSTNTRNAPTGVRTELQDTNLQKSRLGYS